MMRVGARDTGTFHDFAVLLSLYIHTAQPSTRYYERLLLYLPPSSDKPPTRETVLSCSVDPSVTSKSRTAPSPSITASSAAPSPVTVTELPFEMLIVRVSDTFPLQSTSNWAGPAQFRASMSSKASAGLETFHAVTPAGHAVDWACASPRTTQALVAKSLQILRDGAVAIAVGCCSTANGRRGLFKRGCCLNRARV